MDFVQSLREQVQKASGQDVQPWGYINPLVVIGLTESVLDSGATEEGIFRAIRAYSRQLAADVSPDRNPTAVSQDRLAEIMQAFNYLDNRDNFRRALSDFKILKAEDRRESRLLSQTLSIVKKRLSEFEAQADTFNRERKTLDEKKAEFVLQEKQRIATLNELESQKVRLEQMVKTQKNQIRNMLSTSPPWKKLYECAVGAIANFGITDHTEPGIFAFEAKWVAVVSIRKNYSERELSPLDRFKVRRKKFREAISTLGIQDREQEILLAWETVQEKYGKPLAFERDISPLGLSLLKLTAGNQKNLFGENQAASGKRIIGCIPRGKFIPPPSKDADLIKRVEEEKIGIRLAMKTNMAYEKVLEFMSPYLTPGGLLVSISTDPRRKATWSLTCPAFKFTTRRIILAVG